MMHMARRPAGPPARTSLGCLLVLMFLLDGGCASAVQKGRNTALDGDDLVRMTDTMARSMAAAPGVVEAIHRHGRLTVVVQPVENYMTAEVLSSGAKLAFVGRLRSLLAMHAPDRFTWIMNRDAFYALRGRELEYDLGPRPDAIQPRYALTARFDSITNETAEGRASSYLCVYQLSDLTTREVIWADKYEVRKSAVRGFLD